MMGKDDALVASEEAATKAEESDEGVFDAPTQPTAEALEAHERVLTSLCDALVVDDMRGSGSLMAAMRILPRSAARPGTRVLGAAMGKEMAVLARLLERAKQPGYLAVVIGGRATVPKLRMLSRLVNSAKHIILAGELAQGIRIVAAEREAISAGLPASWPANNRTPPAFCLVACRRIYTAARRRNTQLHLPLDFLIGNVAPKRRVGSVPTDYVSSKIRVVSAKTGVSEGMYVLDVGTRTQKMTSKVLSLAKTVLWVGTVGETQYKQCRAGSKAVLTAMQELNSDSSTTTVIAGDDTRKFVVQEDATGFVSLCSTGGEATIRLLAGATMPSVVNISDEEQEISGGDNDDLNAALDHDNNSDA